MRLIAIVFSVVGIASSAAAQDSPQPPRAQEAARQPSSANRPPLPTKPSNMQVGFAHAVVDKGHVFLVMRKTMPVIAKEEQAYVVQVPVSEMITDGQGGETLVQHVKLEPRTRIVDVIKEVSVTVRYPVSANEGLAVTDATGKPLSEDKVMESLAEPALVCEFVEKPDPALLRTLRPDAVVLVWKDDLARSSSVTPEIAEPSDAADSR